MRTYDKLTKAMRKFTDAMIQYYPEVLETGICNRTQVLDVQAKLAAQNNGKCGHPIWLTGTREFKNGTRGWYNIPVPGGENLPRNAPLNKPMKSLLSSSSAPKIASTSEQEVTVNEQEFEAELLAAGIQL